MPRINLHGFLGAAPKIDARYLTPNQAQVSDNCKLSSGAVEGWRTNAQTKELALGGEVQTIHRAEGGQWLQFNVDVDIVKSQLADDATDKLYYTGTGEYRVTNNTLIDIGGNDEFPEDSYIAGLPAPTGAPTAALVGTHTVPSDTAYIYTFVNAWGEESAPSPVSNIVAADFTTGSVDLTGLSAAPAGDYVPITTWRIYRIAVGQTGADYLFVADVAINVSTPQYNDLILGTGLGETITVEDWDFPPADLIGLTEMANGIFAGFVGNVVYFCEPYVPYAWPEKYTFTFPVDIVGIASFGSTLIVTTKSNPYSVSGLSPDSMSMTKLPHRQACVSKRSLISMMDGVVYACPDGLFYIGDSGAKLITKEHYTRDEWSELTPSGSVAAQYDGRYVIFFGTTKNGFIFDEKGPVGLNVEADALWVDDEGDKLYIAIYDQINQVTNVKEFNAGGSRLNYTWRSKAFSMPKKTSMSAAKINAAFDDLITQEELDAIQAERDYLEGLNAAVIASGEGIGDINGCEVNCRAVNGHDLYDLPEVPTITSYVMRVFGDGNLIHERSVFSIEPFRIPISSKYNKYEIEVAGQYPIREVVIATSIRELQLDVS